MKKVQGPRCVECGQRTPAAADKCAHCWRARALYLEGLVARLEGVLRRADMLGRGLRQDLVMWGGQG